jgi:phage shock protein PspC (stress-responsive transcriptional regulator)
MSFDNPHTRLYRRDGVIAGICEGLGERFGISAVWLRLALIAVSLVGGTGVILYLIYWAIVPRQDDIVLEPAITDAAGRRTFRRTVRDKKLSGVCAGLARGWNADPSLIRFAALALFCASAGSMLLVYLVAVLVMPGSPEEARPLVV